MPSPVAPARPGRGHIYLIHIKNGDILMNSFNNKLRNLRVSNGITQKQLAKQINIQPNSVQRLEYGTAQPSLKTITAIADYFDVSIDYLVGRTNNSEINK